VRAVHKNWLVAAPLVTNNNGEQQPMCQRMETSSSANEACTYTRASCTNTNLYRSRGHGSHVLWIMSIWLRLRLLYISYMGCRLLCILHLLLNGLLHVLDRLLHLHCMRVCLPSWQALARSRPHRNSSFSSCFSCSFRVQIFLFWDKTRQRGTHACFRFVAT